MTPCYGPLILNSMKKLFCVFQFVFWISQAGFAAVESSFFVNQAGDSTRLSVDYSQSEILLSSHIALVQQLGFQLQSNINGQQIVWFNVPMANRTIRQSSQATTGGYSFSDFSFGSQWGNVYQILTLTYGMTGSISPGLARNPELGLVEKANSFSGFHTLAPFVGFESYSGPLAFGALFEVRLFSDLRYEDSGLAKTRTNPNHFIPKFKGFAQIPAIYNFDLGVQASISRNNFALDEMFFGSPGNEYEAEMYGVAKLDKNLHLQASINAASKKYPINQEQTQFKLGLTILQ